MFALRSIASGLNTLLDGTIARRRVRNCSSADPIQVKVEGSSKALGHGGMRVWCLYRYERFDQAEEVARADIRRGGRGADPYLVLACLALRAGDIARALDLAQQAVGEAPASADAAEALGLLLLTQGRCEDAAVELGRALALAPENHEILPYLSLAHTMLGHRREARRLAVRAFVTNPSPRSVGQILLWLHYFHRFPMALLRAIGYGVPLYVSKWQTLPLVLLLLLMEWWLRIPPRELGWKREERFFVAFILIYVGVYLGQLVGLITIP